MIPERCSTEICGVCGCQAAGLGYAPPKRRNPPVIWVCSIECLIIARDTYSMKQHEFNRIEILSVKKGGEEGGSYLDQIKKTDLAQLSREEWEEFCRRIVAGYRKSLKYGLENEAPF